jgi:hypothetical protein
MLNSLGDNAMIGNVGVGLNIVSRGVITVTGVDVSQNTITGIFARNETATGIVLSGITYNKITARGNGECGIAAYSKGKISISNSWAALNADDGIKVKSTNSSIYITNSTSIGNDRAGIRFYSGGTLSLTNSTWFGNLKNPVLGDANLKFQNWIS